MSASGMRAASPTASEPVASARNAGIRAHVISSTTRATPSAATMRRDVESTTGTRQKLTGSRIRLPGRSAVTAADLDDAFAAADHHPYQPWIAADLAVLHELPAHIEL